MNWNDLSGLICPSAITALFTILGGVVVLVLGQLAEKFFIAPIHKQAEIMGEIGHSVVYYANVAGATDLHPPERVEEAKITLRRQASELRSATWAIRWYRLWDWLGFVQKRKNVLKATEELIGWSNSLHRGDAAADRIDRIKELLNFH